MMVLSMRPSVSFGMSDLVTGGDVGLEMLVHRVLAHAQPELILLFGSRAWGVPRPDSDYDLMLVFRTGEMVVPASDAVRHALWDAGFSVDVLGCTVEEYERRQHDPGLLSYKIARDGRILYTTGRVRQYTAPTAYVREHPPREGIDMWLDRAERDFRTAQLSFAAEPPEWAAVCFHAQQYAEKTLKALVAARGGHPPKTHELPKLLELLPRELQNLEGLLADCALLTSLYPRSRYPDAGPNLTTDEGQAAMTAARRTRDLLWPFIIQARAG